MVGLDAAILMHPRTWEASGHVESFVDPMVDCRQCKVRFRADEISDDVCPECGAVPHGSDGRVRVRVQGIRDAFSDVHPDGVAPGSWHTIATRRCGGTLQDQFEGRCLSMSRLPVSSISSFGRRDHA